MDNVEKMKDLITELNAASDAYYNGKEPLMSDIEFDNKLRRLTELEKETGVTMSNSPTVNVGAPVLKGIKTVKMDQKPMLSLDKVHSYKEVVDFSKGKSLVASVKCDGLSTRLVFKDGRLESANTRGNGVEGSDITEHVKHFTNIPLKINKEGIYIVDGESIIKDADFDLINSKLPDKDKLKNSRNAASGTLASLDTSVVGKRRLSFILWDVIEGCNCSDFYGRLHEASEIGFEVVPYEYIENVNEKIVEIKINTMFETSKLKGIPNDGIVFRLNDIKYGDSLGCTAHHFLNACAYKREQECYETTLIDVEYTMGKTGSLCPVAIFEPVEIDGAIVEKASLHNISIMRDELKIVHKGQKISVFKANQIIPQLAYASQDDVEFELSLGTNLLVPPSKCPICGAPTTIKKDNNTEVLYCTSNSCPGKLLGKLTNFVSKQGLDIDGLSEATLSLLLDKGFIHSCRDIFHLKEHRAELSTLPKMGSKSVSNLLKSIEHSRKTTLDKFLTALSIQNLGRSTAKDISVYCHGSIDEFIFIVNNRILDFMEIDGVGTTIVESIENWWSENSDIFYELLKELDVEVPVEEKSGAIDLSEKTFCITGSLNHFSSRDELKTLLESMNAKVSGSVSKNTFALICNDKDSNTGKSKRAKEVGINIWTEDELLGYISETN